MNEPLAFRQSFAGPDARSAIERGHWQRMETGGGRLVESDAGLRLTTLDTTAHRYANAQIDDYQGRARRDFLWRPPLALSVRARFSHDASQTAEDGGLRGTAGFGFWNDPFLMTGRRLPTLPRAIWFFYASPPSDIVLDSRAPGFGLKAATLDALRPGAALLAVAAPFAVPLINSRTVYRAFWPAAQRVLRISEAMVPVEMTGWHTYTVEWGVEQARFLVDESVVLECDGAPRGRLGLVIWLDNQYLVATPWGRLRYGLLTTPGEQWLELDSVEIRRHGGSSFTRSHGHLGRRR
jgi:hypothetical protein